MLPTLYKMTTKGKIQEWTISTDVKDSVPFYSVKFGQKGGSLQTTEVFVKEGKNVGRKNGTTPTQQCLAEASALWTKQKDRKGYSEHIPTEQPLLPMLAKEFLKQEHKVQYPCFVQPKLDGIRAIFNKGQLTSRTGNVHYSMNHILNELKNINVILDGELYSDTLSFQEISSLVRKSVNLTEDSKEIKYRVYDIIDTKKTFHQRNIDLNYLISDLQHTQIVPTYLVTKRAQIDEFHKQFLSEGYEGTMIRNLNSKYKLNSRSDDLLKYKDFIDEEFVIIGHKVGIGKFSTVPTFVFKMNDGKTFEAVPKGSAPHRANLLKLATTLYGQMATVRFFEYTDDKKPRFPVMVGVRDYE